tara:strand:+ start:175 stop:1788 length:1614 start_codon:yes stop_codon:yes gene_type:complete
MADLSQQLKELRTQKKRENIQRFTKPLGIAGDILTGGAVSRGIKTWNPKDRALTNLEKINSELALVNSQKSSQQQSVANKETVRQRVKDAELARKNLADLQRQRDGVLTESENKKLIEWQSYHKRKTKADQPWSSEELRQMIEDLRPLGNISATMIIQRVDPALFDKLSGKDVDQSWAHEEDLLEFRGKILGSRLDRDTIDVKIEEGERAKAEANRLLAESEQIAVGQGVSGPQTGIATGSGTSSLEPSPGLYAAGNRIRELQDAVPDNRKESEQQTEALMQNEDLIKMAEDLGIDPKNSIEMSRFVKTATKAQKRAEKVAKMAEERGWTDEETSAYLYKLPTDADEEGRLTTKVKENRMVWKFLGVENPDFLRAEDARMAAKHKDRLEERKWENLDLTEAEVYGEDYDPQDTRDLGMPEDLKWLNEEGPDVGPTATGPDPLPETVAAPEPEPAVGENFEMPVQESPLTDEVIAGQDAMLEEEKANVTDWSAGRTGAITDSLDASERAHAAERKAEEEAKAAAQRIRLAPGYVSGPG